MSLGNNNLRVEFVHRFSTKLCAENPHKIFVFGDNFKRYGKAGQAVIRDSVNAFGIPTKLRPTMDEDAFLDDKHVELYKVHLASCQIELLDLSEDYTLVFPIGGLGTGLSQMPYRCPLCFQALSKMLETFTHYKHTNTGFSL